MSAYDRIIAAAQANGFTFNQAGELVPAALGVTDAHEPLIATGRALILSERQAIREGLRARAATLKARGNTVGARAVLNAARAL